MQQPATASRVPASDIVVDLDDYIKQRLAACDLLLKEIDYFYERPGVTELQFRKDMTKPTIEEYDATEKKCIEFVMSQLNDPHNEQCIMHLGDVFLTLHHIINRLDAILKFPFNFYKDRQSWTPNGFFDTYFKRLESILVKLAYYDIIRSNNLSNVTGEPDEPIRYDQFSEFKHVRPYAISQAHIKAKSMIIATIRNIVIGLNKELARKYGKRYTAHSYQPPTQHVFYYYDTRTKQSFLENPILTEMKRSLEEQEQRGTAEVNAHISSLVREAVHKSKIIASNSPWFFKIVFPDIPELTGVELVIPLSFYKWPKIWQMRQLVEKTYPELSPSFKGYQVNYRMFYDGTDIILRHRMLYDISRTNDFEDIPNATTLEIKYPPLRNWYRYEEGRTRSFRWPQGGKKQQNIKKNKTKSKSIRNIRRSYKRGTNAINARLANGKPT